MNRDACLTDRAAGYLITYNDECWLVDEFSRYGWANSRIFRRIGRWLCLFLDILFARNRP